MFKIYDALHSKKDRQKNNSEQNGSQFHTLIQYLKN